MPLHSRRLALGLLVLTLFASPVLAQIATVTPLQASVLQKLLPTVDGWTVSVSRADQVVISPEATYTFASVALTKGDVRVRVQVSDTGKSPDSLTALAMVVVSMPPDFAEDVAGASIRRTALGGSPAAELWDAGKGSGEITAVVGGRFVVTVDSSKVDSLGTLRGIFEKVDLKALASLK